MDKVVKQILDACGLEDTTRFGYYDDEVLSFKRNIMSTVVMDKGGTIVARIRIYYSYGKPVCAIVDTASSNNIVWWDFRESSTTYRGLYEFLNRTNIKLGHLNRNDIKMLKQTPDTIFITTNEGEKQ